MRKTTFSTILACSVLAACPADDTTDGNEEVGATATETDDGDSTETETGSSSTDTDDDVDTSTDDATTTTTDDTTTTTDTDETTDDTDTTETTDGPDPICGDGNLDEGEECDDGNDVDTDECTVACTIAICGDLVVQEGVEACDDGNMDDGDGCNAMCMIESCGDGVIQAMEECDDGNDVDTDECTSMCIAASCGDMIVYEGVEECDDGNDVDTDDCLNGCTAAECGDGVVQADVEECDDGNDEVGDGCSDCGIEEPPNECGGAFTLDWCLQVGTMEQYTRCEQVQNNGNTCINPEIRYGNVEGGIPRQHPGNQFPTWCQQLGFSGFGAVQYGARPCLAPQGGLFGCTGYDENAWHWCDWQDGPWYNQQLDWHQCNDGTEIISFTCTP